MGGREWGAKKMGTPWLSKTVEGGLDCGGVKRMEPLISTSSSGEFVDAGCHGEGKLNCLEKPGRAGLNSGLRGE